MSSFKEFINKVPTAMGGLALGISSLGAVWALVMPEFAPQFKVSTAVIAAVLLLLIIIKFATHPKLIVEDISHPVVSSVMPTTAMGSMVVAQSLLPVIPSIAKAVWLVAVCIHICLFIGFVVYRLREFELHHMVPSWFVPPVGLIVAAVTSTGMGFHDLVWWLFTFGVIAYALKLPVMCYRLLFREKIPDSALPTFAIMAAPASLSLTGYLTIASQPDYLLVAVLLPLAIFMTGLVYIAFIRLLRLPFSPGYAAFTFPMVIGTTALYKTAALADIQLLGRGYDAIINIAQFELWVATAMVLYVSSRYVWFYFGPKSQTA